MASVNLKQLIARLNDTSRRMLEGAAGLCLSRTNYNVEVEHWFLKLLELTDTDLNAVLRHFEIEPGRVQADLTRAIDKLKTGNARPPALSPDVVSLAREAWLLASIDYQAPQVRTGHLLLALLSDDNLARTALEASSEFERISPEALKASLASVTAETSEAHEASAASAPTAARGAAPSAKTGPTSTPSLDQYTIDLTENARNGKIDPVLGRDAEIRQIMDILCRRRQNNPILTGEAGVGKTAVAEGFALRIASGDVPPALQNVSLRSLDLGLLQAGAGVKGEFENRLKGVIDEVKASPSPIILFIDEAHTMIGAGGQAGQGDAANLLKPALARGELRTVAATTWAEYKKYFERDAALARRFQVVKVEEPSEPVAVQMMRGLVSTLEDHHGVRILNEAVEDAVRLSSRYISGRQLPDKSVSLLDTTAARIGLSQNATPSAVEDCQRQISQLDVSIGILEREQEAGADHAARLEELRVQKELAEEEFVALNSRWEQEKALVTRIRDLYASVNLSADEQVAYASSDANSSTADEESGTAESGTAEGQTESPEKVSAIEQLQAVERELVELQGDLPLVHPYVNSGAVAETIESWTGIPVGRMVKDEIETVLNLRELMEESVVGQSHAMQQIADCIRTSRANLDDPGRPIGVFLLAGTSGVGKTETGITLANLLYGGEQNMTVINMSEFKEEHKVSLLMGSPPGYVGYGEGGVLTEAVRRKPYSVVLLDEMEKAHPGVQDIFYQVFDKGTMKDGEGRDIDFRNTVILMTSNAGTDFIKSLCADPDTMPDPDAFATAVFPELLKTFKPAFLGRLNIVPYYPLSDDVMRKIIGLKLGKVERRVREHYKAGFSYSDRLIDTIAARCTEVDTGARNVDHILSRTLLPELSAEFLSRMAEGVGISSVSIDVGDDGNFSYQLA
jgi:type VI secretion system protein VasG